MPYSPPIADKGSKKARSVRVIDLTRLEQRLLNAISRDSYRLLDVSYVRMLDKSESENLSRYLKIIRELRKSNENEEKEIAEEELTKLARD